MKWCVFMVGKKVRLGTVKRLRKNGCLCLGKRPEGLTCLGVENGTMRMEEMHIFVACGVKSARDNIILIEGFTPSSILSLRASHPQVFYY